MMKVTSTTNFAEAAERVRRAVRDGMAAAAPVLLAATVARWPRRTGASAAGFRATTVTTQDGSSSVAVTNAVGYAGDVHVRGSRVHRIDVVTAEVERTDWPVASARITDAVRAALTTPAPPRELGR